jgi:hypothetical protein
MADADDKPRIPSALKKLVLDYQNTCVFMLKAWRRLMLILAFAFPAAFYLREATILQAMVNAVGFWIISAVLTRFLVLEFRLLRAGWVARKIEKRIPAGHPARQAVIDWINEKNDGNFLNSLLKKLGGQRHVASLSATPYDPTTFINGVLEKLGKQDRTTTQTYYFSQTQMLNENGEWVTVESFDPAGSGPPPEAAMQQALEEAEPPAGFKPIPIAAPAEGKKKKKRKRRRRTFMPLDPEAFDSGAGTEGKERR